MFRKNARLFMILTLVCIAIFAIGAAFAEGDVYAGAETDVCAHENIKVHGTYQNNIQPIEGSATEETCSYIYDMVEYGDCIDCGEWVEITASSGLLAENQPHEWDYRFVDGEVEIFCWHCDFLNPCEHEWVLDYEGRYDSETTDNGDGTHDVTYTPEFGYNCPMCDAYYWQAGDEAVTIKGEPHNFWNNKCEWCGAANPCTHANSYENGWTDYFNVTVHEITPSGHTVTSYKRTWYICEDCNTEYYIDDEEPCYENETLPHLYDGGQCWVCDYVNTCTHPNFEFQYEGFQEDWQREDYIIEITDETHTYWAREFRSGNCPDCGEYIEELGEESFQQTEMHGYNNRGECWLCGHVGEIPDCYHYTIIKYEAVASTCSTAGRTEGILCQDCGEWVEEPEELPIDPYAHIAEIVEVTKEPTCDSDGLGRGVCSLCEQDLGDLVIEAGHAWMQMDVSAPTCNSYGAILWMCERCGDISEERIAPLEHEFIESGWADATCTHAGGIMYSCASCGEWYVEEILDEEGNPIEPILEHKAIVEDREPTCTEDGYVGRVVCANCGEVLEEGEIIESTGEDHVPELVSVSRPATCETSGVGRFVCSVCGEDQGYKTIPAEHTWETVEEVVPTCEEEGYIQMVCALCDAENVEYLPPIGHIVEILEGKEASCEVDGLTEGEICVICGSILVEQEIIPAKEHSWIEDEEDFQDPTCEEEGRITFFCENCKQTKIDIINPTGHWWEEQCHVEASCTEPAGMLYICARCDEEFVQEFRDAKGNVVQPALGHEVMEESIPATCTDEGLVGRMSCLRCGEQLAEGIVIPVDPNGHVPVVVDVLKEATCTSSGISQFECIHCGNSLGEMIVPAGHQWEEVDRLDPTCLEDGYVEQFCIGCEETQRIILPATGAHDWYTEIIEMPSCGGTGIMARDCGMCGKHIETFLSATGVHRWVESWLDETCTEPAYFGQVCEACGELGEISAVDGTEPLGHAWYDAGYEGPNCDMPGAIWYNCSRCDERMYAPVCDEEGNELEPARGHEFSFIVNEWDDYGNACYHPTCTEDGFAQRCCDICGLTYAEGEVIPALGHQPAFDSFIEEPTCTEEGLAYYYCASCGEEYGEGAVPAYGHEWEMVYFDEPTCSHEGYGFQMCAICGEEQAPDFLPPHVPEYSIDIWEMPGCSWNGYAYRSCNMCGEGEEIVLPATEIHVWIQDYRDETCTQPAYKGEFCAICGVDGAVTEVEGTKPLGHDWWEEDYEDARCDYPASLRYRCERCGEYMYEILYDEEGNELEPALGHEYEYDYGMDGCYAPTCTEDGFGIPFCVRCDHRLMDSEIVPALGHDLYEDVMEWPGCGYDGFVRHYCGMCDYEEYTKLPATGEHTWEEVLKEETCTDAAFYGNICVECGQFGDGFFIEGSKPLGHDWIEESYYGADCEEPGRTLYFCERCGEERFEVYCDEDGNVIDPAYGHDISEENRPVTCQQDGLEGLMICGECGKVLDEGTVIKSTGTEHIPMLERILKEPSCTTTGLGRFICEYCGESMDYQVIPAEHAWYEADYMHATCTEDGYAQYMCELCEAQYMEVYPANGHENRLMKGCKATCEEDGLTDGWICNACGEILVEQEVIPPLGHSGMIVDSWEPTCEEEGRRIFICERCGLEIFETIEPNGHIWMETYFEATCYEPAMVGQMCQVCKMIENLEAVEGTEPLGHNWTYEGFVGADCEYPAGERYICYRCGEMMLEVLLDEEGNELEPALGHLEVEIAKEPTCSENGFEGRIICQRCALIIDEGAIIPATEEHVAAIVSVLKPATCTTSGIGKFACMVCGMNMDYGEIAPNGEHSWIISKAASCTSDGMQICELCGEEEIIPANGEHSWTTGKEATCGANGMKLCVNCGMSETIPATGNHKWTTGKEPTCNADGMLICEVCGAQQSIPSNGEHKDKLVAVVKEATCESDGIGRYVCEYCGVDTGTKPIPGGHSWMTVKHVEPTCVSDGYIDQVCASCGTSETVILKSTGEEHGWMEIGISYNAEDGELTNVDDSQHLYIGPATREIECIHCGAHTEEEIFTEVYEEHDFKVRGEHEDSYYCACDCGKLGHNPDNLERWFSAGEVTSYRYANAWGHSVYCRMGYGYECTGCWSILEEFEWLDGELYSGREAHTFEDGVCVFCGYEEMQAECDHSEYYVDYGEMGGDFMFVDTSNPNYHVETYKAVEQYYCRLCDAYLGEGDVVIRNEYAPHEIEEDWDQCMWCGYEFACLHENKEVKLGSSGGCMEWAPKDEYHHTFYGSVDPYYQCTDCDTIIWSEDLFGSITVTDINGIEEEHSCYANGECAHCGYVPEGIVVCDQEFTYAVPGMEFAVSARLLGSNPATEITYTSGDSSVVEITADGRLRAVGAGMAEITVSAEGFAPDTCKVSVLRPMVPPANAGEIQAEAFIGSAVRALDLSACDGIFIGDRAFADCGKLVCVLLPETLNLGEDVFDMNTSAIFYCRSAQQAEEISALGYAAVEIG